MREIDLKPGQYRWRRPLHPLIGWGGIALAVGMLVWMLLYAADTDPVRLILLAAFEGAVIGGLLQAMFGHID